MNILKNSEKIKNNIKLFFNSFLLRLQLFKIWFFKNSILFLKIFLLICLIFIITGGITENTPFFGYTVYPIFRPLIDEIQKIIENKQISNLMDLFRVMLSVSTSVGMFAIKARAITLSDIKSIKLKTALVKANLYFNQDGKLVKRIEKVTNTDLDNDGKIANKNKKDNILNNNIITNTVDAIQELITISTIKIDGDSIEENQEIFDNILEETNLTTASNNLEKIEDSVIEGVTEMLKKDVEKISQEEIIDEEDTVKSFKERLKARRVELKEKKNKKKDLKNKKREEKKQLKELKKAEKMEKEKLKTSTETLKEEIIEKKEEKDISKKETKKIEKPEIKKEEAVISNSNLSKLTKNTNIDKTSEFLNKLRTKR